MTKNNIFGMALYLSNADAAGGLGSDLPRSKPRTDCLDAFKVHSEKLEQPQGLSRSSETVLKVKILCKIKNPIFDEKFTFTKI